MPQFGREADKAMLSSNQTSMEVLSLWSLHCFALLREDFRVVILDPQRATFVLAEGHREVLRGYLVIHIPVQRGPAHWHLY